MMPRGHKWKQIAANTWKCVHCPGYFASVKEPDEEAIALDEQQARSDADRLAAQPEPTP